ncbi:sensor histidine kinase [Nonomuraea sp. NPDC050404]|uniref:sensor histidine kinase n=1 Tax=Nonomuraea sp. NPDC050404 TaxID=3155783 RepID=UPI003403ACC0
MSQRHWMNAGHADSTTRDGEHTVSSTWDVGRKNPTTWDAGHADSLRWDAAAAVLCVLVFWLPTLPHRSPWPAAGLIALLVAGLLVRSRWPAAAFAAVTAATLAGAALGMTHDPFVASAWVLYRLALTHGSDRSLKAVAGTGGVTIATVVFLGTADAEGTVRYTLLSLLALAGAWVLGSTTRRAALQAEQAMLAERQAAVTAERLRVAREVHDIVSHSLGTIAVTSGVAARTDDPGRMRDRLGRIETVSRQALDDLRTTLGAVRDSGEGAERHPQPGIPDLSALVDRVRDSGVAATLTVRDLGVVPAAIGLAVYRVAQEGLTNAARHAPGTRCTVTLHGTPGALHISITDDGPASAPSHPTTSPASAPPRSAVGPGYGLVGLRERVELLGGRLTASPRPGRGFELHAVIPLPEAGRA